MDWAWYDGDGEKCEQLFVVQDGRTVKLRDFLDGFAVRLQISHPQGGEWGRSSNFGLFLPLFLDFPDPPTGSTFVVSMILLPAPPWELEVAGGDFVTVLGVFVAARVADSNVEESLGLTDGERTFLPSSMSRSKTNPMAAPRCGVRPSEDVRREEMNNPSFPGDFIPVSNSRRSIVRIVTCFAEKGERSSWVILVESIFDLKSSKARPRRDCKPIAHARVYTDLGEDGGKWKVSVCGNLAVVRVPSSVDTGG